MSGGKVGRTKNIMTCVLRVRCSSLEPHIEEQQRSRQTRERPVGYSERKGEGMTGQKALGDRIRSDGRHASNSHPFPLDRP